MYRRRCRSGHVRHNDVIFESLETRQMLSTTLSVTSYGAIPNDGRDDRAAIQAAVNASAAGDTVYFPAGTYNLSSEINLKGAGRIYKGAPADGATVIKGADADPIFHIREDNTRIDSFTLDGKPVMIDQAQGKMIYGAVVNNNVMYVHGSGDNVNGVTFTTGLGNSAITNNRIENNPHVAIYGYYWDGLTIANNELVNGNQGMHLDTLGDNSSKNLLIEQNYISGMRRMGVEYQGAGINTIVQDNYYENPVLSSVQSENNDVMAFSVIADRSIGTIARRNTVIAPQRPDGWGVRVGFEIGGDNALVEQNYIVGTQYCVSGNDYNGSSSVTVRNNRVINTLNGPFGRLTSISNNGPAVVLNWDINRVKPGRNRRYGDASRLPQRSVFSPSQSAASPGVIDATAQQEASA